MVVRPPAKVQVPSIAIGPLVLEIVGRPQSPLRLTSRQCTIGSSPNCTIRLRGAGIANVHCQIVRGEIRTIVRRLSDQTLLNGKTFQNEELLPGDVLKVGPLELRVASTGHPSHDPTDEIPNTHDQLANTLDQFESNLKSLQQMESGTEPVRSQTETDAAEGLEQLEPNSELTCFAEPADPTNSTLCQQSETWDAAADPTFEGVQQSTSCAAAWTDITPAQDEVTEQTPAAETTEIFESSLSDEASEPATSTQTPSADAEPECAARDSSPEPVDLVEEATADAATEIPVADSEGTDATETLAGVTEPEVVESAPLPCDSQIQNVTDEPERPVLETEPAPEPISATDVAQHETPEPETSFPSTAPPNVEEESRQAGEQLWLDQQAALQAAMDEIDEKSRLLDERLAAVEEQRRCLTQQRQQWDEQQAAGLQDLDDSRGQLDAELAELRDEKTLYQQQQEAWISQYHEAQQQLNEKTEALEEQLVALSAQRDTLIEDYQQWKQEIAELDEQHLARSQHLEQRLAAWEAGRLESENALSERHERMEEELAELRAEWKVLRQRQDALAESNPRNRTAQIDHRLAEVRAEREAFEHQRRPGSPKSGFNEGRTPEYMHESGNPEEIGNSLPDSPATEATAETEQSTDTYASSAIPELSADLDFAELVHVEQPREVPEPSVDEPVASEQVESVASETEVSATFDTPETAVAEPAPEIEDSLDPLDMARGQDPGVAIPAAAEAEVAADPIGTASIPAGDDDAKPQASMEEMFGDASPTETSPPLESHGFGEPEDAIEEPSVQEAELSLDLSDILARYGRKDSDSSSTVPETSDEETSHADAESDNLDHAALDLDASAAEPESSEPSYLQQQPSGVSEPEEEVEPDDETQAELDTDEYVTAEPADTFEEHRAELQDEEDDDDDDEEPYTVEASHASSGDDEEESIDDYMAKLMARVRGIAVEENPKSAKPAASSVKQTPRSNPPAQEKKSEPPAAAPQEGLKDEEFRPRTVAPEKTDHLSAMRELANQNARMALDSHTRQQLRSGMRWKLITAISALLTSFLLMWIATWQGTLAYFGALTCMVVAVVWGLQYLMLMTQFLARGGDHDDEFDDFDEDDLEG